MAWMIIKSAGDEYSFTVVKVDGEIGHTYDYARALANKVTDAMQQQKWAAERNELNYERNARNNGWTQP